MPKLENGVILAQWRIHTPALLKEIGQNPSMGILGKPLTILGNILHEVGEAAARINDPELNALMMRLTIYEQADPYMPGYDKALYDQVITDGIEAAKARAQTSSNGAT